MTFRAYNIVREKKATKIWLWTTEISLKPEKCLLCCHQNDLLLGKGQIYLCDCVKCDFKLGERWWKSERNYSFLFFIETIEIFLRLYRKPISLVKIRQQISSLYFRNTIGKWYHHEHTDFSLLRTVLVEAIFTVVVMVGRTHCDMQVLYDWSVSPAPNLLWFLLFFFPVQDGDWPRALNMLGRSSTTELYYIPSA